MNELWVKYVSLFLFCFVCQLLSFAVTYSVVLSSCFYSIETTIYLTTFYLEVIRAWTRTRRGAWNSTKNCPFKVTATIIKAGHQASIRIQIKTARKAAVILLRRAARRLAFCAALVIPTTLIIRSS